VAVEERSLAATLAAGGFTALDRMPTRNLEVAVDVHALVQYSHDIDDAVRRDPVVQGVLVIASSAIIKYERSE